MPSALGQLERDLEIRAPLGSRPVGKIDTRTLEGKRHKGRILAEAVELFSSGDYIIAEVAGAVGVSPSTLSLWLLLAGRRDLVYRPDRKGKPATGYCHGCGEKLVITDGRQRRKKYCGPACYDLAKPFAPQLAEAAAERDERIAQEARERDERIAAARAEYRRCKITGQRPPWEVAPPTQPERDVRDEQLLESLVAQQTRELRRADAGWGERPPGTKSAQVGFARSLDERFETKDGGLSAELYEFVGKALPSAEDEYLDAEHAAEVRAVLGGLNLEDVARLDERTLERLRDKLRDAGLVHISVARGERERLRMPSRHRGSAPPPIGKHGTKRHHRHSSREASELMRGKRPSRKPRKRWDVHTWQDELDAR